MITDPFRSLTLRLPSTIICALKSYCAAQDTTMQKYMCKVIMNEMEKVKKKEKTK